MDRDTIPHKPNFVLRIEYTIAQERQMQMLLSISHSRQDTEKTGLLAVGPRM